MRGSTLQRAALALAVLLALTGCAGSSGDDEDANAPLIVFAAASLQASFDELAEAFEAEYPQYSVAAIEYDGSQALATRIVDGADVDVIAFANEPNLEPVTAAGAVEDSSIFATNTLQIAVPPGNPQQIETLEDLADPDLSVVLCAPEVPCGTASQELLGAAGVDVTAVSLETNVTSVVNRVALGEADAGLVYATDVTAAADRLEGITPAGAEDVVNRYPIAVAVDAPSAPAAQAAPAFMEFVQSAQGQAILAAHGFGSP